MGPTLCGAARGRQHFSDWLADINKTWCARLTHVSLGVYFLSWLLFPISFTASLSAYSYSWTFPHQ